MSAFFCGWVGGVGVQCTQYRANSKGHDAAKQLELEPRKDK